MGQGREADPVKLVCGMLSAYPGALAEAEGRLVEVFGPVDLRSDLWAHAFTEYYRDEMGHPLARYFVAFDELVCPSTLAAAKRLSNRIEADVTASGQWPVARPVNLDPGYVAPAKLVLASTKDYAHRVYLGEGVWAELTLRYAEGRWQPLDWTYPDYRTPEYHTFFGRVRDRLKAQRRAGGGSARGGGRPCSDSSS